MVKKILLLTLCYLLPLMASAQKYHFKQYGIEQGLAGNETYSIIQASNGLLWIGSLDGVSSFDGKNFTNYTTENGLPSNLAFRIFEDSNDRIWVGTVNKGYAIIENGKVFIPSQKETEELGMVRCFLEAKDGTVYIFFSKGIAAVKDGVTEVIRGNDQNLIINTHDAVWYDDNTIYLASNSRGVVKITLNPYKEEYMDNASHGINNICYAIEIDSDKNIWVGAYGELYKIKGDDITKYKFNKDEYDLNRVYSIYQEGDDTLYLGFEGNGFAVFQKESGDYEMINEKNGLPTKYIYNIEKDNEGNFWMATYGAGIVRFRNTAYSLYDETLGLPANSTNDAYLWEDRWMVGTDNGMVSIKDGVVSEPIVSNKLVRGFTENSEGNLLIAEEDGVYELSKNGKQSIKYKGVFSFLKVIDDYTFLNASRNLRVINKDTSYTIGNEKTYALEKIGDRFITAQFRFIRQLRHGKFDIIPGLNPKEYNNFRDMDALDDNSVIAVNDKYVFLIELNDNTYKIKKHDIKKFGNFEYLNILRVDGNNLWMGSRGQLVSLDIDLFRKSDSIKTTVYRTTASFMKNGIDASGLRIVDEGILLGTSRDGMIAFDRRNFTENTLPPRLEMPEVLLFSEPLNDSLYRTSEGIVLPYKMNYLSFMMEAITFTYPENVKYKYRLKGLRDGDGWSVPSEDSQAVFSYIPPGSYTFEFTADNGNGVWQEEPYVYSFVIKVPFWRTWGFWFAFLTLASLGIILVIFERNKSARIRQEKFAHDLIQAQENERTRVARELHDSVGQKLMLLTKKTKATGNLEMEALAGNTLEELRSISRGLHPATMKRLGVTAAIVSMINEVDQNTNIFFTNEIENIDHLLSKDASLHLYRIVQEVLNNMVKHSEAKAASVTIEAKSNGIYTVIKDNGKGFSYSEKSKITSSLGMKTLMERAKILHSKLNIQSEPNKGTTIYLSIPT
ncbi:sensor histidine kinase [Ulvibacter antarcticus]|uniref:histidine kinase n=1 Tax=Ulvibacter antarcticus TaxID=442714 RepID=A0A3L9Z190_9FLAO|nr:sensor histidine kinase [Ulvibacter antarcticus]RMA65787.1 two component regulator with propeller domain [Ulvibacter antarcticus]